MSYTQYAIEKLKSSGLRITLARKSVLEILDASEKALSVSEIMDLLALKHKSIDKVSIYRILDCLEEHNLIHKTLSSGKVVKCSQYKHIGNVDDTAPCPHHLFTCNRCGKVTEIEGAKLVQLPSNDCITITDYNLELFGHCNSCE